MNSEIKDVYVDLDTSELDELLKPEKIKYYLFIENDIINGRGCCKRVEEHIINYEVSKEIYDSFQQYIYQDGELILNPNYEAEQEAKEQERIAMLSLTSADVERGIYKAKDMDFDDIIEMVKSLNATTPEEGTEGYPKIDIKALKIELKANNFYRSNPYVDAVGSLLGFTKEQLDAFFETNDYTKLLAM